MRHIAENIEQECCTEGCDCDTCPDEKVNCAETCDGETCTCDCGTELEQFRARWEREYRAELARLQKRVAQLEEQQRGHASRQICALMTEIDSLERNILGRDVTTSKLKKAGMDVLGVDGRSGPAVDKKR